MKHPALDPSRYEAVPLEQQLVRAKQSLEHKPIRKQERTTAKFVNDGALSPLELYTYLRTRFGPPNGMMMLTRNDSVDNLIHWHYEVSAGPSIVSFVGLAFRTEVMISGGPPLPADAWSLLVSALKEHMVELGRDLKSTQKTFEQWSLFVNQYRRIANVVESHAEELRTCQLNSLEFPDRPTNQQESKEYSEKLSSAWKAYKAASEHGLVIRMLSPVMGEAFVNFLIMLLALPEIRNDRRLLEDLHRKPIDIRLKTLHLNCVGFREKVDQGAKQFREFLSVMNRRNDFLHGNPDPKLSHIEHVYFDQRTIPLLASEKTLAEFALGNAIAHAEPDTALHELAIVESLVEYLLSCLEKRYEEEVRLLASEEHLGYEVNKRRFGGILPRDYVEMHTFTEATDTHPSSEGRHSKP